MWDRCEVRCIGFYQDAVVGDGADHVVTGPVSECDDSAKRYIPACIDRSTRQSNPARVTVQHAANALPPGLGDHGVGIIIGVASMNNYRQREAVCKLELRAERPPLQVARRVVVVIVQAALSDGDRTAFEVPLEQRQIGARVERRRVVRVNSCGIRNEARMRSSDPG